MIATSIPRAQLPPGKFPADGPGNNREKAVVGLLGPRLSNTVSCAPTSPGKSGRFSMFALLAASLLSAVTSSGCTKECISDLDCDRAEDGTEQVCSVDNVCVAITPSEVQSCGNNAQCDDGGVGGTGICWDGQCRYRPTCLLFDGPLDVGTDCGGTVSLLNATVASEVQGPCTSTFSFDDDQIHVTVNSLSEFEPQATSGRSMTMTYDGAVELCTDGQFFVYENVGHFEGCSTQVLPAGCSLTFRPSVAGGLCDLAQVEGQCDEDAACVQINTLDSRVGACVKR